MPRAVPGSLAYDGITDEDIAAREAAAAAAQGWDPISLQRRYRAKVAPGAPMTQFDAFLGNLDKQAEEAAQAGYGFRADLRGLGDAMPRRRAVPGSLGYDGILDNQDLAAMPSQGARDAVALDEIRARQDAAIAAQKRSEQEQRVQSLTASPLEPTTLQTNENATDFTMRPSPVSENPTLDEVLKRLSPLDRQAAYADLVKTYKDQALKEAAQKEIARHNVAGEEIQTSGMLSDDAITQTARRYIESGVMPPLGMGDKTTRQRVLNRAAELAGAGANVAANAASYGADTASLKKLQTQRDAISSFENTALKNIDIFLDTAGKVVDTGSPLANVAARTISGKVLGSPDVAAFEAARRVAINEVAKITSNPNLSGQLSDNARREVENFNPESATLAQSVAVMRILKQDMANRAQSMDQTLADIKGRLSTSAAPPATGKKQYRYDQFGNPIEK